MSKFKIVFGIVGIIGLLPLAAEAASSICNSDPSNIVQNCGFETGNISSWTQTGNYMPTGYNYVSGNTPNSGNFVLEIGNYNYQGLAGVSQSLKDISGYTYQVSFWLRQDNTNLNSNSNGPTQLFTASWDGTSFFTVQNQPKTNWTQYTFNFIGTGSDTIAFSGYSNAGFNYLDDVNVHSTTPTPLPAALWMVGSALAAGFPVLCRRAVGRNSGTPRIAPDV